MQILLYSVILYMAVLLLNFLSHDSCLILSLQRSSVSNMTQSEIKPVEYL